tara:strand:+ start:921 stop:1853 length:933 start_codon:yes stop_codon:yes gene_type:complete
VPHSEHCNISTVPRPSAKNDSDASVLLSFDELQPGDLLVWVGAGRVPWVALRKRNVTVVWYNTEPLDNCVGSRARHVSVTRGTFTSDGQQCIVPSIGHTVHPTYVDEVWDYSAHNLEVSRRLSDAGSRLRLVPPGAVASVTPVSHSREDVATLTFLGSVGAGSVGGPRRKACWNKLKAQLGPRLRHVGSGINSDAAFASLAVDSDQVFLNLHRRCEMTSVPLERFRLQRYLSAGQLVVSEPAHPDDMARLQGIVTFANLSDIALEFEKLANRSRAERIELTSCRHHAFVTRCAPGHILHQAGGFDLLVSS